MQSSGGGVSVSGANGLLANSAVPLPAGLQVIERGWLSANTVVAWRSESRVLIDSGHHTHTAFMDAALRSVAGDRPITAVYNTHLHSDHCGGNAWLAEQHPGLRISIPARCSQQVTDWNHADHLYESVGQHCPRFVHTDCHGPGDVVRLGELDWQVLPSPGHDNDSVMFFNPDHRILMSADALWEQGFGVLFPLIDGADAITDQLATLDLIESLQARVVIPGHGSVFTEVNRALDTARARIASFVEKPERALQNACRVLMKFNLLEHQRLVWTDYRQRFAQFPAIVRLAGQMTSADIDLQGLADRVADALVAAGAARWEAGALHNL